MSSDVLVTGASGFFGTALVPRLVGANHRVTALSRTAVTGEGFEVVSVDLRDPEATRRSLSPWRWGVVVHLAGPAPKGDQSWADAVDTITAHVRSLIHVMAAIPRGWSGRFIHASGAIIYGNPTADPVEEDHPRRPLHPYALAKCLTEDVLLGSTLSDRWLLRMGGLFSETRRSGGLFNFVRAAQAGETLRVTSSSPPIPWEILHVDDAVEAVLRSMSASARDPGPVNVGYGEPVQIVQIAERIARRSRRGSTVTLEGPEPPVFHADIAKARRLFDWPPATLDDRLDRLWQSIEEDNR